MWVCVCAAFILNLSKWFEMMRTQLALIRILPVFVCIVECQCRSEYSPDIFQLVSLSLFFDSLTVSLVCVFAPRSYFIPFHLYNTIPCILRVCACVRMCMCVCWYTLASKVCKYAREFRILFMSLFYGINTFFFFFIFLIATEYNCICTSECMQLCCDVFLLPHSVQIPCESCRCSYSFFRHHCANRLSNVLSFNNFFFSLTTADQFSSWIQLVNITNAVFFLFSY